MRNTILLAALLTSGCGGTHFIDDEGSGDTRALSQPYAPGTAVDIVLDAVPATAAWQARSDKTAVLTVDGVEINDKQNLVMHVHAGGEGTAVLTVVDDAGATRASTQVSVIAPDSANVFANGELRALGTGRKEYSAARVVSPQILVGGEGMFAVVYFKGSTRVYGHGIVSGAAPLPLIVENQTTLSGAVNEWVSVRSTAPGTYDLPLQVAGVTLASLSVTGVAESDVASVQLVEEEGARKGDKAQVWILARAATADGKPVFGTYFDWTLDGAAQARDDGMSPATGNLYRYHYSPTGPMRTVTATRGGVTGTLSVPAYDGSVYDTSYLGCSAAPGRSSRSGGAPLALICLLLAAFRRGGRGTSDVL